ncbi:protein kinase C delta type-like [Xenopus tropicalis]|uniref:Protein kinase C delta type-like n=1 Tax=Xenopus tropicalis TaxID=8364 RepID=A0A8J1IPN4_XENTR|nr:protein kinase C delta type-like [Xenopus tropicalis]
MDSEKLILTKMAAILFNYTCIGPGIVRKEDRRFYSAEIICGLQYLYSIGIVHRDLKPDNILLDQEGHIKIADFGLAAYNMFGNKTARGRAGTRGYMAPEVLQMKKYNAAADWWSLGVIIYQMATHTLPFYGGQSAVNDEPTF